MASKINPSLHGSSNYLARNFTISCKSEEDLQASVSIVHSARCVHTNRRQTSQPNFTEPHTPQVKGILGLKKIGYDHHQHLNTLKLFFLEIFRSWFEFRVVFLLWFNSQKTLKNGTKAKLTSPNAWNVCVCNEKKTPNSLDILIYHKKYLHRPGIEPGPPAWQASILPLNQRCFLTFVDKS